MSNIYYDVRVDIQKDIVIDSGLRFTQGDSKVIYLRIAVMNGGVEFDASNTTPSVNFVKPDGTYVTGTPVKSGNFWIYQILGNELQKAGKVLCDIKFTYESGRVSSSKFTFIVEKDTTISDAEASSSYILPMEELLIEMQNYKNQGVSIVEASAVNATEAKQGATDAKNEADRAKDEADKAAAIVGIEIANTTTAGIVKIPTDGSITIDSDGTIHSNGGSTFDVMKKSQYDADDDGVVDNAGHATNADNVGNADTSLLEKLSDSYGKLNYNGNALMLEAAQFANQAKLGEFVINQISNNVKELALHSDITTKLGKVDNKIDKPASATDGQVLTYNATSDEWEAQDSKGGGADTSIISDAYDELKSYVKGNYCIYDNALWKALGSSQGAMPTEGTLWTKVSVSEELDELNSSLTLDYSNAGENVRDVNTLLQKLLNKFYTDFNEIIVGLSNFSVVSNSSNWVHLDKTFDISEFNGVVNISFTITSNNGRIYIYGIKNGVETALYSKEGFTGSVLVDEIIDASRYDSIKVKIGAFSTTTTITNVVCEAK